MLALLLTFSAHAESTTAPALGNSAGLNLITINKHQFIQVGDQLIDADRLQNPNYADLERGPLASKLDSVPFAARPTKVELWTDGVIPITFGKDIDAPLQKTVFDACLEWAKSTTHLHCQLGAYKGQKLKVTRSFMGNNAGCWSMLGQGAYFMGIRRHMNLGYGCDRFTTVLHEMGHVLGLAHEHQRSDRDNYVVIHQENIADPYAGFGIKLNFARQKTELVTAYDFLSIMHYHRDSFSKNGGDTIVPRDQYSAYIDKIGHAEGLSELDREAVRQLYSGK